MPRTQHDMKCVGMGLPEGSPLKYEVHMEFPETNASAQGHNLDVIGGLKATLQATSEAEARHIVRTAWPYGTITTLELL